MTATIIDLAKRAQRGQPRTGRGTYAPQRTVDQLLRLIGLVTQAAASAWPDRCPDPQRISQVVWNAAKELVEPEHGHIPQANEITRQLRAATGRNLPWSFWVQAALGDHDLGKVVAHLLAEPPRPPLTPGDIALAMLTIARRLGRSDFSDAEYDLERRDVFHQAGVQGRGEHPARTLLPNSDQIITACGSWEAARTLAGFQPKSVGSSGTALAPEQAIVVFYAHNGYLPQRNELITYMGSEGFALAKITTPWNLLIDQAIADIATRPDLPPPPPYGVRQPKGHWMPVDPGIDPPRKGVREYPLIIRVATVREFHQDCAEDRKTPTHRRYRQWHTTHPDHPSLNALIRDTSMKALLELAKRPDWETAAAVLDAAARDERRRRQADQRTRAAGASPNATRVTELLATRGSLPLQQVALALGWSLYKTRHVLPKLVDAGVIARTEQHITAKSQRYTLPPQRAHRGPHSELDNDPPREDGGVPPP